MQYLALTARLVTSLPYSYTALVVPARGEVVDCRHALGSYVTMSETRDLSAWPKATIQCKKLHYATIFVQFSTAKLFLGVRRRKSFRAGHFWFGWSYVLGSLFGLSQPPQVM
jgi:hypothetical protein